MIDINNKTLLTGLGLAAMTKDRIEEFAKDLVEKGEMSVKEGKELIDELWKKSEQARKDLETKMEGMVQKAIEKLNMATKEDIAQLNEKIEGLEQRIKDKE